MKASDFMVYDLLRQKSDGKIIIVKSVEMSEYLVTDVEPIPITAEFLATNGFSTIGNVRRIWINTEDFDNHAEIEYRIDQNWLDIRKMANRQYVFKLQAEVHHVHELQHLLRAAGLADLANGFRIYIKKGDEL